MKLNKVYETRSGLKFCISEYLQPSKDGVVWFTGAEWDYVKANLSPEEFKWLHAMRQEDYRYPCIPSEKVEQQASLGVKMATEILDQYWPHRGKKNG